MRVAFLLSTSALIFYELTLGDWYMILRFWCKIGFFWMKFGQFFFYCFYNFHRVKWAGPDVDINCEEIWQKY